MIWTHVGQSLWLWGFLPLYTVCAATWLRPLFQMRGRPGTGKPREEKPRGTLSDWQAAGAALAATVGTGNIVGTAQAIAMGGPGAVFWMWAAALLGMPVKAAEILLGQRLGGAAGYIRKALGQMPAMLYALFAFGNVLILGNMVQMNTAASLVMIPDSSRFSLTGLTAGLVLTSLIALCLRTGLRGVSTACVKILLVMAGLYLVSCAAALCLHARQIAPAFRLILRCAMRPRAIGGAAAGLVARRASLWGLRRGALSNEAGLGTAANIHAYTAQADPRRNALWGLAEVFLDTLLCTCSALVILSASVPIPYGSMPGSELVGLTLTASFGERPAIWLLVPCLGSFAISTVLGSYISGHRCAVFLGIDERIYRTVFLCCAVLGPILPLRLVWSWADAVNILMALPNLLSLLLLSRRERGAK